ncbi:MAG: dipeptidase PepV [Firmicutes bacterium]|nr:dipeptidase PepV [Bacillota bacterium]
MKEYQKILAGYREEMFRTLQELVSIESVVAEPKGGLPFGENVEKVFRKALQKCEDFGFETFDADHFGGHAEFGEGEECMGILAHLDVVPLGEGWDYDPLGGIIENGRMYGRGTNDDKGPAVAAMYALRAVKESGAKFNKRVRLIFGLDEEVGEWEGIYEYFDRAGVPDFGFTPDADFPLVQAEMGILVFDLVKKFGKSPKGGCVLKSIQGGQAYNMVADKCSAVITGDNAAIKSKVEAYREHTAYEISCRARGRSMEVTALGVPAHGAHPEKGVNAISIMMDFLKEITFGNDDVNDFIEFYNKKIGFNLHGWQIGAGFKDELSGDLIWNTGVIDENEERGSITVNIRYPVTGSGEEVYEGMAPHLDEYGVGVVKLADKEALCLESDDPLVVTLMDIYRKHTGDEEAQPLVIGGGTYARVLNHGVAYGIKFPGEEATEHQKNEYIDLDNMMKAAAIYAEAIFRLCCAEEENE